MRILASPAFANEKVNPYNALLYRELEKQGVSVSEYSHGRALLERFDLVHFHWPDGYINQVNLLKAWQRLIVFVAVLLVLKVKHTKIVWTVHNITPHDAYHPKFSRRFLDWFINRCDGFIFMSDANQASFLQRYTPPLGSQWALIPHGHYRNSYPPALDKTIAQQQLKIPDGNKVLLFFGMIKPYKNIPSLMQVFNNADLKSHVLVIAGNVENSDLRAQLDQLRSPQTHLLLGFIPDEKLSLYLSAADYIILPYKAILNSGALLLALSFNKPVIAPHMGAIVSMQRELGTQWVYSYADDLTPTSLRDAIATLDGIQRPAICPLDNYQWDKLAGNTLTFYQQLLTPIDN
jgi:beta-1,4-mannosyltransferase